MGKNDYIQLSLFDDLPPQPFTVTSRPEIDAVLGRLSRSKFRAGFHLSAAEKDYAREKGPEVIRRHALDIIDRRLAPAYPENDGKQTPTHGHPVFRAQHATGTCCRECLRRWHHIPLGQTLTPPQREYIADVILAWIAKQVL